jgi:hypothetical protein
MAAMAASRAMTANTQRLRQNKTALAIKDPDPNVWLTATPSSVNVSISPTISGDSMSVQTATKTPETS